MAGTAPAWLPALRTALLLFSRVCSSILSRFAGRAAGHWLVLINLAMGLTILGAIVAPTLRAIGLDAPAGVIHSVYLLLCPQRPAHSYYLFGYQLALEQRELAMFGAQLAGGLVYALVRHRVRVLDWRLLAILSVPIVWDGISQTFGLRTSDWLTRTWTGALFNLAFVFWLYPRLEPVFAIRRTGLRPREPGGAPP